MSIEAMMEREELARERMEHAAAAHEAMVEQEMRRLRAQPGIIEEALQNLSGREKGPMLAALQQDDDFEFGTLVQKAVDAHLRYEAETNIRMRRWP